MSSRRGVLAFAVMLAHYTAHRYRIGNPRISERDFSVKFREKKFETSEISFRSEIKQLYFVESLVKTLTL